MEKTEESSSLMNDFKEEISKSQTNPMKYIGLVLIIVLLGVGSGYLFANRSSAKHDSASPDYAVSKGKSFGVTDTKDFPDTATGIVKAGGIEGEGAYHLERTGGESQNVYMTSSALDLSQFITKKVKVWGTTQTAQHAGWLMDVGKLEVL
jgi:hypothetical protein